MGGTLRNLQAISALISMAALSYIPIGTNIFEEDWELLIILDACRVDALHEVSNEFGFIESDDIGSRWSLGSTSKEWIDRTFSTEYRDELVKTAYITANGFSHDIRSGCGNSAYVEFDGTWVEKYPIVQRLLPNDRINESELGLLDGVWGDPNRS